MRAHDAITRDAYDAAGRRLGRIVDLVTEPDGQGRPRVVAAIVAPHWHGRLLGYERTGARGPWLVERVARWLYRGHREVPWARLRLDRV
jgi:hypothetical protein